MALLWMSLAFALRPDAGANFPTFDEADVVQVWDSEDGILRIHFSTSGPNAVQDPLSDPPRIVQLVEETALDALSHLDDAGFLPPTTESEAGLPPLGGTDALDAYLVDFGGSSDGRFILDGCLDPSGPCAGHFIVENDFVGYSYPTLEEAVETVVVHELFHGVQASYLAELPAWVSEGTAAWSQRFYDEDNDDFLRFAEAYLSQLGRSLDRPPSGPVPSFAYGTCIWWDFLVRRHDPTWLDGYFNDLRVSSEPEATKVMAQALDASGDSLREAWEAFALATLSRGFLFDPALGHPYGDQLSTPVPDTEGPGGTNPLRVYPLSIRYDRVEPVPPGLQVVFSEPNAEVSVFLVPEGPGGVLGEPLGPWKTTEIPQDVPLDAGALWVVTAYGAAEGESMKGELCLGTDCLERDVETEEPECGCADGGMPVPGGPLVVLGPWLLLRRRRSR